MKTIKIKPRGRRYHTAKFRDSYSGNVSASAEGRVFLYGNEEVGPATLETRFHFFKSEIDHVDWERRGWRLGVFWHTQGSGKSLSMVFFCQKILRTVPGNWTFVIVMDRQELDEHLYKTFAVTGAVTTARGRVSAGYISADR